MPGYNPDKETNTMSSKFNAFIGTALEELNRETSKHLGDRSQYVGGSDVGNCLRKALEGKINEPSHDKKTLLRFLRKPRCISMRIPLDSRYQARRLFYRRSNVLHRQLVRDISQ